MDHAAAASAESFAEAIARQVDVIWSGNPLRAGLHTLSEAYGVPVVLDRRIDPDATYDLELKDITLGEAFEQIARAAGAAACPVTGFVYIGPGDVCRRLPTLAAVARQQAAEAPPRRRSALLDVRPWAWPDFAAPRDLLAQLADDVRLPIDGLTDIPHDLWAGVELPAMTTTDRLTLVAIQFDRMVRLSADGSRLEIVPAPEEIYLRVRYPGGADVNATAARFRRALPDRVVEVTGSFIVVEALLEEHERLVGRPERQRRASARRGDQVHRLNVDDAPLAAVLERVADDLELELVIDHEGLAEAGIELDQLVTVSVSEATLDDLLEALLEPAGLSFRRTEKQVEIFPRPADEAR